MAFEVSRAFAFLKAKLVANSTVTGRVGTRVYERGRDPAKDSSLFPYITMTAVTPRDLNALNGAGPRIFTQGIFDVQAVGYDRDTTLPALADAMDTALQKSSGSQSDAYIYAVVREAPIDYSERSAGNQLRHLGGQYRVVFQVP